MYLIFEDVANDQVVTRASSDTCPMKFESIYVYPADAKTDSDRVKYVVQDFYRVYVANDEGEYAEMIRVLVEKA